MSRAERHAGGAVGTSLEIGKFGDLIRFLISPAEVPPRPEEVCRWEDDGGPIRAVDDGYTQTFTYTYTAYVHTISEYAGWWGGYWGTYWSWGEKSAVRRSGPPVREAEVRREDLPRLEARKPWGPYPDWR